MFAKTFYQTINFYISLQAFQVCSQSLAYVSSY
jgi:hypothetical protein